MGTTDDLEDDDHNDHDRAPIDLREMQLHHCGPGRAGNPKSGEPIAILRLLSKRKLETPIMLNLTESRRLLAKLVAVLAHFDDPLAKKVADLFFPSDEWPADAPGDVTNPRPAPKHLARPSVRLTTPQKPLTETDVWQMARMLRNVRDHETFMRFIGVPESNILADHRSEEGAASQRCANPIKAKHRGKTQRPKRKR